MEPAEVVVSTPASPGEPLLRPVRPNRPSNRLGALLGLSRRRGSPALVRETAALQLEQRRADWAYSSPVVALDVAWNLAFAVAAAVILSASISERPPTPVRLWISGYALQCLVHVGLVASEYRRRRRRGTGLRPTASDNSEEAESEEEAWSGQQTSSSIAKRCESLNTLASFLWWIVGFYWVISGGEVLLQNAPKLYWLTVVYLAFDVFFAIFCIALACVIGIALCCCLPCIIAILYAIAGQEGVSDADISILPRYRYSVPRNDGDKASTDTGTMIPIITGSGNSSNHRNILREDAECCICLTPYVDGIDLHALPCNHHFHSACIIKWLRINATCPLCKYNILKGSDV